MQHRVVTCKNCGRNLDEPSLSDITPCPECGATVRSVEMVFQERFDLSDRLISEHRSEGRTIGVRDLGNDRSASADDHRNDRVSMNARGKPPQGEEDTLGVCRLLVRNMNRERQQWNTPELGVKDVDCIATNAVDLHGDPLCIQVVKAIESRDLWKAMALSGQFTISDTATEDICDQMAEAIRKKIRKIPLKQRRQLVLALDASRLPGLTFDSVVGGFRQRHGTLLNTSGFVAIWIVGPTESLTKRLDLK